MPILTSPDEVAVGMRLHRSVYDGLQLLLPAGKALNSADVDYLRKRCSGAAIYVEDPVLDELVTFDDDRNDSEVAQTIQTQLVGLLSGVQEEFSARLTLKSRDCRGIEEAIEGVLACLERNPVMAMYLVQSQSNEDYLVSHAAQAFYLSLVMGNAVRSRVADARERTIGRYGVQPAPEVNLTPLALGALFMDIAMLPMKEVFSQAEPLSEEQCRLLRNHPITGAASLPADTPAPTKLIIETHHENFDGTGYPYGLRGDEIHIFARILRIADAFSAATASRVYKEAISPVRALWGMTRGAFAQFYDPTLVKVFAGLLQPFPIGGKLKLSSGEYGVVVRFGRVSPFLPEIIVAFDENGERLDRSKLRGPYKLDEERDLKIVSYVGEDLTNIYDHSARLEPVTASEFTTLYESVVTGCATTPGSQQQPQHTA